MRTHRRTRTHRIFSQSPLSDLRSLAVAAWALAATACGQPEPSDPARYAGSDRLFETIAANIAASETLEQIVAIDHSRLGAVAGSVMPPARVLIFSDRQLEAALLRIDPRIAIDLPLRVLAYESVPNGASRVIFNSFDYLRSRYALGDLPDLAARFEASMSEALEGIAPDQIAAFTSDSMRPDGIITLASPFDFETTVERLRAAIDSQDDTVWFGEVDFQARAQEQGIGIAPNRLLLFGGPAPGAKAMAKAPTLGLDAFCQKLLVWQDGSGEISVSFNDLLALANRQGVPKSVALRVINRRLQSVFGSALEAE